MKYLSSFTESIRGARQADHSNQRVIGDFIPALFGDFSGQVTARTDLNDHGQYVRYLMKDILLDPLHDPVGFVHGLAAVYFNGKGYVAAPAEGSRFDIVEKGDVGIFIHDSLDGIERLFRGGVVQQFLERTAYNLPDRVQYHDGHHCHAQHVPQFDVAENPPQEQAEQDQNR